MNILPILVLTDFLYGGLNQICWMKPIFHSRISLLYYNDEPLVKKGESNFDVSMSAYDGAEVCELIGIFILSLPSKHINKNHIGLYRVDGLAILKNISST